jgi:hypothetical protein
MRSSLLTQKRAKTLRRNLTLPERTGIGSVWSILIDPLDMNEGGVPLSSVTTLMRPC